MEAKTKLLKCLDGKERVFTIRTNGEIHYRIWKDGKPYGKSTVFKSKYPKFITKEMLLNE